MTTEQFTTIRSDFAVEDEKLYEVATQELKASFWEGLRRTKERDAQKRTGDLWHIASIPVAVIHEWHKRGWKIDQMSADEIIKKLREENLEAFITTSKRIT